MSNLQAVSRDEWLVARLELLDKEKAHSRARDELTKARRSLPWVKLEKEYTFAAPSGPVTLAELFDDKSQLIIQHFMFDPDLDEGCKSCSFMADHMDRSVVHLAHRDTAYAAVSKAPLSKLLAFQERMGWGFQWVSSEGSDFNRDFHVSFTEEEIENGKVYYNFREGSSFSEKEAPGISVFAKDEAGDVYHTYSVHARGLETFITTYDLLDLVPKGRNEDDLPYSMQWLRLKDRYEEPMVKVARD
jgi:predicted dithiol-disulfide oxidoreductase (DUF899 family)